MKTLLSHCSLLLLWLTTSLFAVEVDKIEADNQRREILEMLKQLSPEELSEVETFNPKAGLSARKLRALVDTDAAAYVLKGEEIHRAGITRLAEALRLIPGLQVARISPYRWAISTRGLNEENASKLLVMIDGRTVYSALRSEVQWDLQDLMMDDIDRIEVVRGPGASLWGANAVNGIINIITKSAADTQNNKAQLTLGNGEEKIIASVRHGGKLVDNGHYRIYAKYYEHGGFFDKSGTTQDNDWQMLQGGFRADWQNEIGEQFQLQGNVYTGTENNLETLTLPTSSNIITIDKPSEVQGFNLLSRWQRDLEDGEYILQGYYTQLQREDFYFDEFRGTFDLDFQHRKIFDWRTELLWGLGFRYTYDDLPSKSTSDDSQVRYTPIKRQDKLFSAFIQGEFALTQRWRVTLGSKFEYNDYSGFEYQPSLRSLYHFDEDKKHSLWAGISRAVRTPSRSEEDLYVNNSSPVFNFILEGNKELVAEELLAYELGYRFNLSNRLLIDLSLFYNDYDNLRNFTQTHFQPFPVPTSFNQLDNQLYGDVYGLELSSDWQVKRNWKLRFNYSYTKTQLELKAGSTDPFAKAIAGNNPEQQITLHSMWDINPRWDLDLMLYYNSQLPNQNISAYTRLDLRLAWHMSKNLELSIGGRNLLDPYHPEFRGGQSGRSEYEVPRAWYLQTHWQF